MFGLITRLSPDSPPSYRGRPFRAASGFPIFDIDPLPLLADPTEQGFDKRCEWYADALRRARTEGVPS